MLGREQKKKGERRKEKGERRKQKRSHLLANTRGRQRVDLSTAEAANDVQLLRIVKREDMIVAEMKWIN